LRAVEHGERITIAFCGVVPGEEAAALEAGADIVWPSGVSDAVVVGAVRRASARSTSALAARSFIEAASDALFVLSDEGHIRAANAGVQAMLGRASAELEGRALCDLVDDDDADLVRALMN